MGERLETTRPVEESILAVASPVPPDEAYVVIRAVQQMSWTHNECGRQAQSLDGRLIDLMNKGSAKVRCQCGQFVLLRRRLIVSK